MRFLTRSLIGVFLLAMTAGLLALAGNSIWGALQARWGEEPRSFPARERIIAVNVVPVAAGRADPVLTAFGEIRSRRTLELRVSVGGEVVWLSPDFEEGGAVTAGQRLLQIDPQDATGNRDLAANDLAEAEAELRDAERALVLAGEDLEAAEDQATLRERALTRQRDLAGRGVGTDAAVETAELAASSGRQAVVSRRQALAQAEARLDQARTTLDRRRITLSEAERRLADTEVFAEFDGVLSGVSLVEGGLVSGGENLGRIIDPDALEVSFSVPTAQYGRLIGSGGLRDAPVTVSLDVSGMDIVTEGRITRESAAVAEGQSGRLIFARLDAAAGFRPGDFVTVSVREDPLEGVASLPATAVDAAGTVLVLGEEDRLEVAQAPVLRRQGNDVIVDAAAIDGREVVAERSPLIGEGIKVRPVRPAGTEAEEPEPDFVELDDERRAKLVAFVEGNQFMPADVKTRILGQLQAEKVPAQVVARLEGRMGG
jgi:hypothetical protein